MCIIAQNYTFAIKSYRGDDMNINNYVIFGSDTLNLICQLDFNYNSMLSFRNYGNEGKYQYYKNRCYINIFKAYRDEEINISAIELYVQNKPILITLLNDVKSLGTNKNLATTNKDISIKLTKQEYALLMTLFSKLKGVC